MKLKVLSSLIFMGITLSYAQRPDAPTYAQDGPFAVSARDFVIEDAERTLPVTIWYPAVAPADGAKFVTYEMDAGPFVGTLATPTFENVYADLAPDVANGPYPLVVFAHGNPGTRHLQLFFPEHLASYGFVVIAADHPGTSFANFVSANFDASYEQAYTEARKVAMAERPRDMLREIAFVEDLNTEGRELAGLVDTERIAITGFSAGGAAALGAAGARLSFGELDAWCEAELPAPHAATLCDFRLFESEYVRLFGLDRSPDGLYPAVTDSRIDALITLGAGTAIPLYGTSGLAEVTVPSIFIYGTGDSVVNHEHNSIRAFENVSSEHKSLVALNADHFIFTNPCTDIWLGAQFPYELCSDPVWDMNRAQDITKHFATAFLREVLYGDADAKAALEPENAQFRGVSYQTH